MVQESPWKNIFNCLLIILRAQKKLAAVIQITNYQVAVILINVIKSSVDGPSNTCTSKQALKIYNILNQTSNWKHSIKIFFSTAIPKHGRTLKLNSS